MGGRRGSAWIIYSSSRAAQTEAAYFKQREHDVCYEFPLCFVSPCQVCTLRFHLHLISFHSIDQTADTHLESMQPHMLPKQKKARSGFGSESKKAACQGALNLWSNLSLIFLQPETSVSGDARSHWHYSPEKLTAWTVKHGALVRNHTERLIAISYQLHQHSLTHLLTLRHSLANPKK